MKIRKAVKKDIPRILRLFNSELFLTGNDELRYNKNHIEEYVTNPVGRFFVYEVDGKIVGAILVELRKKAKYIYLDDIIVDRKYRKQGIGSKLMDYIENLAKKEKIKLLFGFTEISNKPIHKLLKKRGYERGKKFYFFSKGATK